MKKKIGITGANGHVGANLIRKLIQTEHDLRLLQYRDHEAFNGLAVEVMTGDLNDRDSLDRFCENLDVVIHLAAKISIGINSFDSLSHTNIDGTRNIVHAAKKAGVKRLIHFSSIHALDHKPFDKPVNENRPLALDSTMAYERSKAIAEKWVLEQQAANFDVIVLNPTSIIGPYDYKPSLMGQFVLGLYNKTLPGLTPGGYDWVDVRDVCDAAVQAVFQGRGGERYILSGTWKTVVGLVDLFGQVTNRKFKLPVYPFWLAKMGVPFIMAWSKISGKKPLYTKSSLEILQEANKKISCEKAVKELGYRSRPLAETLKDAVDWFIENKYLS